MSLVLENLLILLFYVTASSFFLKREGWSSRFFSQDIKGKFFKGMWWEGYKKGRWNKKRECFFFILPEVPVNLCFPIWSLAIYRSYGSCFFGKSLQFALIQFKDFYLQRRHSLCEYVLCIMNYLDHILIWVLK